MREIQMMLTFQARIGVQKDSVHVFIPGLLFCLEIEILSSKRDEIEDEKEVYFPEDDDLFE